MRGHIRRKTKIIILSTCHYFLLFLFSVPFFLRIITRENDHLQQLSADEILVCHRWLLSSNGKLFFTLWLYKVTTACRYDYVFWLNGRKKRYQSDIRRANRKELRSFIPYEVTYLKQANPPLYLGLGTIYSQVQGPFLQP